MSTNIVFPILNDARGIKAFTMLEMLVTILVLGMVFVVAASPDLGSTSAKKKFQNNFKDVRDTLSNMRNEAMLRGTTTRMVIDEDNGVYTIATYFSAAPTNNCSAASVASAITSKVIEVHPKYEITGNGMAGVCFYRDGSASGGSFAISPIEALDGYKTATITIIMATGFMDVEVE